MEAFIAFIVLMGVVVIRQDGNAAEIREIEAAQERAPRKRRNKRKYRRQWAC